MKIVLISFLLVCQGMSLPNISFENPLIEEIVWHREGHIIVESLSNKTDLKIGLIFPEESEVIVYYPCTNEVIEQAKNILRDRPNGSEVFLMIVDNVVWELKLCHEHNGKVIECGNEL